MNTAMNAAAATAEQLHLSTPDADHDFEIHSRLGRIGSADSRQSAGT